MKVIRSSGRIGAFTLLEMLCVIGILTLLITLLLPALTNARARARRIECVSQLRQTGIAFHAFAHDHNGHFPMRLPAGAGGTAESALAARGILGDFSSAYCHLQALSNDLVTPKLLVCPADDRKAALSFGLMQNANVSYFSAINADYSHPNSILAGDRNLTNDWAGATGAVVRVGGNFALRWTFELHRFKGNILFSDGRIEEKNNVALAPALNQFPPVAELVLPGPQLTGTAVPPSSGAPVPLRPLPPSTSPGTLALAETTARQLANSTESDGSTKMAAASTHKKPEILSPPGTGLPARGSDPTNASKPHSGAVGLAPDGNPSQKHPSGVILSLLPSWAVSGIQSLAGKAACVFYAVFFLLLLTLLAIRLVICKKPAISKPENEIAP